MFDRAAFQTIVTKLDQNAISPAEAKKWVKKTYGIDVAGRTREQVIRDLRSKVPA